MLVWSLLKLLPNISELNCPTTCTWNLLLWKQDEVSRLMFTVWLYYSSVRLRKVHLPAPACMHLLPNQVQLSPACGHCGLSRRSPILNGWVGWVEYYTNITSKIDIQPLPCSYDSFLCRCGCGLQWLSEGTGCSSRHCPNLLQSQSQGQDGCQKNESAVVLL